MNDKTEIKLKISECLGFRNLFNVVRIGSFPKYLEDLQFFTKMNLLPISQILIAVALVAVLYKVYLDSKLTDESRKGNVMVIFTRIYSIRHLFPISKMNYRKGDQTLVKKANTALYTFYVCFILAIIIGLIDAFI